MQQVEYIFIESALIGLANSSYLYELRLGLL